MGLSLKLTPVVAGTVFFYLWRDQELFLLIACSILGAAAISLAAGRYFTGVIRVKADWPETAHAGMRRLMRVGVVNAGAFASPSLNLIVRVGDDVVEASADLDPMPNDEDQDVELDLLFQRRGVFKEAEVEIRCQVLGFFRVCRIWKVPVNLTVHPKIWVLSEKPLGPGSPYSATGLSNLPLAGHDIEFLGVREYVSGDSPRLVHWRTSARRGRLFVKEFARSSRADVSLLVDLAAPGPWTREVTEMVVTGVASIVHLLKGMHVRYEMILNGEEPRHLPHGLGGAQYLNAMHLLTRVEAGGPDDVMERFQHLLVRLNPPGSLLVFVAFPSERLLNFLERLSMTGLKVSLLTPGLVNLPDDALASQPDWVPLGPGGREAAFPVHCYSSGQDLERLVGSYG